MKQHPSIIALDQSLYSSSSVLELGTLPWDSPIFTEHVHSGTKLQVCQCDHPAPGQCSWVPTGFPCQRMRLMLAEHTVMGNS